jgi:hypothetical protein
MPMAEYAKRTGREYPAPEAYGSLFDEPARPASTHETHQTHDSLLGRSDATEPAPIHDFGSMTDAEYAQWRTANRELFEDGTSRASVNLQSRMARRQFDNTTRQQFYR